MDDGGDLFLDGSVDHLHVGSGSPGGVGGGDGVEVPAEAPGFRWAYSARPMAAPTPKPFCGAMLPAAMWERMVGEEFDCAACGGFEAEGAAGFAEVAALDAEIGPLAGSRAGREFGLGCRRLGLGIGVSVSYVFFHIGTFLLAYITSGAEAPPFRSVYAALKRCSPKSRSLRSGRDDITS